MAEMTEDLKQKDQENHTSSSGEETAYNTASTDLLTGPVEEESYKADPTKVRLTNSSDAEPEEPREPEFNFGPYDIERLLLNSCNLKSDDITCLLAESVPSSESDENFGSYDYSSFVGDNTPQDSTSQLPEENQLIPGLYDGMVRVGPKGGVPLKLDERTMQAWLVDGSDDSYDPTVNDEEQLITPGCYESDMEEFAEVAQGEQIKPTEPVEEEKANVDLMCFSENSCGDSETNRVKTSSKYESWPISHCSHRKKEEEDTKRLLVEKGAKACIEHLKELVDIRVNTEGKTDNIEDHKNPKPRTEDTELIPNQTRNNAEESCSADKLWDAQEYKKVSLSAMDVFKEFVKNKEEKTQKHSKKLTVFKCTLLKDTADSLEFEIQQESNSMPKHGDGEDAEEKECQENNAKVNINCKNGELINNISKSEKPFVNYLVEPPENVKKGQAISNLNQHSEDAVIPNTFVPSLEKCFSIQGSNEGFPGIQNISSGLIVEKPEICLKPKKTQIEREQTDSSETNLNILIEKSTVHVLESIAPRDDPCADAILATVETPKTVGITSEEPGEKVQMNAECACQKTLKDNQIIGDETSRPVQGTTHDSSEVIQKNYELLKGDKLTEKSVQHEVENSNDELTHTQMIERLHRLNYRKVHLNQQRLLKKYKRKEVNETPQGNTVHVNDLVESNAPRDDPCADAILATVEAPKTVCITSEEPSEKVQKEGNETKKHGDKTRKYMPCICQKALKGNQIIGNKTSKPVQGKTHGSSDVVHEFLKGDKLTEKSVQNEVENSSDELTHTQMIEHMHRLNNRKVYLYEERSKRYKRKEATETPKGNTELLMNNSHTNESERRSKRNWRSYSKGRKAYHQNFNKETNDLHQPVREEKTNHEEVDLGCTTQTANAPTVDEKMQDGKKMVEKVKPTQKSNDSHHRKTTTKETDQSRSTTQIENPPKVEKLQDGKELMDKVKTTPRTSASHQHTTTTKETDQSRSTAQTENPAKLEKLQEGKKVVDKVETTQGSFTSHQPTATTKETHQSRSTTEAKDPVKVEKLQDGKELVDKVKTTPGTSASHQQTATTKETDHSRSTTKTENSDKVEKLQEDKKVVETSQGSNISHQPTATTKETHQSRSTTEAKDPVKVEKLQDGKVVVDKAETTQESSPSHQQTTTKKESTHSRSATQTENPAKVEKSQEGKKVVDKVETTQGSNISNQQTNKTKETHQSRSTTEAKNPVKVEKLHDGKEVVDKGKSILRSNATTTKRVSFVDQKDVKKGDHEMEQVAKEPETECPKPIVTEPDLDTALRFMTEAYPKRDEEVTLSDKLRPLTESSPIARSRKNSPSAAEIYEELKQLQGEDHELDPEPLTSPEKTELHQDDTQKEGKRDSNKISKFFKSFKKKFVKKP